MGRFRDAMMRDMLLREFAPATVDAYLRGARGLVAFYRRPPDILTREEVLHYAEHLRQRGLAPASRSVYHAAIRFLYRVTLRRPEVVEGFVKIRHYGLLASAAKTKHAQAVEALGPAPIIHGIPITKAVGEAEETDVVSPSPVTESDPPTLICAALGLFVCPACRTGVLMFLTEGPDPPR